MEVLRDRDGVMLDNDLMTALKSRYGDFNFSNNEINRALLALETQGLIHVQNITRTRRRIQEIKTEDVYLGVEED
jgi:hypothetical protein